MSEHLDIIITEPLASWKEPTSRLYCLEHSNIRLLVKWDDLVIEEEVYCPICLNTFNRRVLVEKFKPTYNYSWCLDNILNIKTEEEAWRR